MRARTSERASRASPSFGTVLAATSVMDAEMLWHELVRGRWTVEEWFDENGLRVVVARRAPSELSSARRPTHGSTALSPRETLVVSRVARGHSNKRIAYDLGLTVSTVASYIARAATKLGATSRIDLVRAHCEMHSASSGG
jgi:DNA-binding NarL/FixJ family response regulator